MLVTAVSGKEDLGLEINTKPQSLVLAPGGDPLSPSQLTNVAMLQAAFTDVFFAPAWPNRPNTAPY